MVNECAIVESNTLISSVFWKMDLSAPLIANHCKPGQFINILPDTKWSHTMRRPMSIAGRSSEKISIVYKVIGEGSAKMATIKPGDSLDIIGPLGNYWIDFENGFPILLAGGVGVAPILFLHDHLTKHHISHKMIMGTRTKDEHIFSSLPESDFIRTTDDGTYGLKGTVVDALRKMQKPVRQQIKIYACGPPGMLNAVNQFSHYHKLTDYLAVETIMACGFGICQGCAIKTTRKQTSPDSYRKRYVLACVDGPIFNGKDILLC